MPPKKKTTKKKPTTRTRRTAATSRKTTKKASKKKSVTTRKKRPATKKKTTAMAKKRTTRRRTTTAQKKSVSQSAAKEQPKQDAPAAASPPPPPPPSPQQIKKPRTVRPVTEPTDEPTQTPVPEKIDISRTPVPQRDLAQRHHRQHTAAWVTVGFISLLAMTAVIYLYLFAAPTEETAPTTNQSAVANTQLVNKSTSSDTSAPALPVTVTYFPAAPDDAGDRADWQQYADDELGYTVQYPAGWEITDVTSTFEDAYLMPLIQEVRIIEDFSRTVLSIRYSAADIEEVLAMVQPDVTWDIENVNGTLMYAYRHSTLAGPVYQYVYSPSDLQTVVIETNDPGYILPTLTFTN